MPETTDRETNPANDRTTVERASERELVVRRTVNAPARLVWEAWTKAEIFRQWWVPKSYGLTLLDCQLDVRVGGGYRLVFLHEGAEMEFFGTYLEVTPPSLLAWSNEEDDGETITTVTFDEQDGRTLVVVRDRYPSKEALDAAMESGAIGGMPDQLDQLEELIAGFDSAPGISRS